MITLQITITPKKGHNIMTTWGIEQTRPYPTLAANCGSFRWQDAECILPKYSASEQRPGLGNTYRVALLRSDKPPAADLSSRGAYAGYTPYRETAENPGAFELRGVSLGEITADVRTGNAPYTAWSVRGWSRAEASKGERDFLDSQVLPYLLAAIAANREQLKREAVEALRLHVAEKMTEARAGLDALEAEIAVGISKL